MKMTPELEAFYMTQFKKVYSLLDKMEADVFTKAQQAKAQASIVAYIQVNDYVNFLTDEGEMMTGQVRAISTPNGVLTYKIVNGDLTKIYTRSSDLVEKSN